MSAYADEHAVFTHCRTTPGLISDGAARTIASWWADEQAGLSFVTTGAVPDGVWNGLTDRGTVIHQVNAPHRMALEKLRDYLTHHAGRGPVAGWVEVWVR
ncbi:hypothetical protein ACIO6U_28200 [Streptomyces sp. NPDC087422]|uniref:hypothetical protein n=1 Tax=Streptomyces sp. NPDC087422 TaxID=3365786 RepID=UPI0037F7349D